MRHFILISFFVTLILFLGRITFASEEINELKILCPMIGYYRLISHQSDPQCQIQIESKIKEDDGLVFIKQYVNLFSELVEMQIGQQSSNTGFSFPHVNRESLSYINEETRFLNWKNQFVGPRDYLVYAKNNPKVTMEEDISLEIIAEVADDYIILNKEVNKFYQTAEDKKIIDQLDAYISAKFDRRNGLLTLQKDIQKKSDYYESEEEIFCVYKKIPPKWVTINEDVDSDAILKRFGIENSFTANTSEREFIIEDFDFDYASIESDITTGKLPVNACLYGIQIENPTYSVDKNFISNNLLYNNKANQLSLLYKASFLIGEQPNATNLTPYHFSKKFERTIYDRLSKDTLNKNLIQMEDYANSKFNKLKESFLKLPTCHVEAHAPLEVLVNVKKVLFFDDKINLSLKLSPRERLETTSVEFWVQNPNFTKIIKPVYKNSKINIEFPSDKKEVDVTIRVKDIHGSTRTFEEKVDLESRR